MSSTENKLRNKFFVWLSGRVSSVQLSELHLVYDDIEQFCISYEILKQPIFQTTNLEVLAKVRSMIEKNVKMKFDCKYSPVQMLSAINYYIMYVKEELSKRDDDGMFLVNLEEIRDYSYAVPAAYIYFGERTDVSKWKELYVNCCKCLYKDYPQVFEQLKGKSIAGGQRIEAGDGETASVMKSARQIGDEMFVETNLSATDLMRRLRRLMELCDVKFENLQIEYRQSAGLMEKHRLNDSNKIHETCMAYVSWMAGKGMSKEWISSNLLALKQCDKYANDKKLTDRNIYLISSSDALKRMEKQLFEDDKVFMVFDEKMKHRFRNAFEIYFEFSVIQEGKFSYAESEQLNTIKQFNSLHIDEKYVFILTKFFPDGLRQNIIHIKKFIQKYEEYFNEKIEIGRDELSAILTSIGTIRDGRIYAKQSVEQNSLTNEIFNEISSVFCSGATCLYLSMILQRYRQPLGEQSGIYNVDALKALLMENKPDDYYIRHGYICNSHGRADCSEDVLRLLKNSHEPVTYDEMKLKLWYLPMEKIKQSLLQISSVVNVDKETYFYAPNLPISENEQQILLHVIQEEIDQKGFLTAQHLKTLMEQHCPAAAIDTAFMKDWGLRNALGYIFRNSFEFNDAIVNKKGEKFSVSDAYKDFCKAREKMTLDELEEFSIDIHVPIYWDDIFTVMIRISATDFIHKDKIHFNVEAADGILDTLCKGNYIPIQDIGLFLQFPAMEIPWNIYVLECYLRQYSKMFRLDQANITKAGCYGVMVRRNCELNNYEQVVIDMLARSNKWSNEESALELLVMLGYRANRRWKGFSRITKQALLLKEKLEKKEK